MPPCRNLCCHSIKPLAQLLSAKTNFEIRRALERTPVRIDLLKEVTDRGFRTCTQLAQARLTLWAAGLGFNCTDRGIVGYIDGCRRRSQQVLRFLQDGTPGAYVGPHLINCSMTSEMLI